MVTGVGIVSQPTTASVITTTMGSPAMISGSSAVNVESSMPSRRSSDNRRSNKPIMEKRRRARINNCLNELKTLILDAMKKDPARHSKLEKADILEMTVKHLENLQRQQVAMSAAADPSVVSKFRAGFSECAGEVGRFPGLEPSVKRRLLQHLANCLQVGNGGALKTDAAPALHTPAQSVQVHILPAPTPIDTHIPIVQHNGIFFTNGNGTGVQLVPTRLPNGDIALVLPTNISQQTTSIFRQQQLSPPSSTSSPSPSSTMSSSTSPLPMLIPIPTRTASTASAASSTSSACSSTTTGYGGSSAPASGECSVPSPQCYSIPSSPTHEYEHMDTSPAYAAPPMQKPLALVVRKNLQPRPADDEKPWRPW